MTFFDRTDWIEKYHPGCSCPRATFRGEIVQLVIAGNVTRFALRCVSCQRVRGSRPIATTNLTPAERSDAATRRVDNQAIRARQDEIDTLARYVRSVQEQDRAALWWAKYDTYLRSQAWRDKRAKVMERDSWECRAWFDQKCSRKAAQIHHLTYRHVFNEPLFDLVAVCEQCHEHITAIERRQIPREAA